MLIKKSWDKYSFPINSFEYLIERFGERRETVFHHSCLLKSTYGLFDFKMLRLFFDAETADFRRILTSFIGWQWKRLIDYSRKWKFEVSF
jgi:hypothetical protein